MSSDDENDKDSTVNKYLIPITSDKTKIKYKDNAAALAGMLYETTLFWEREGLFQEFLISGAVPMKGGRLAVDNVNALLFLDGTLDDTAVRSNRKPCPDTATRITQFEDRAALAGKTFTAPKTPTIPLGSQYVAAQHEIRNEDNRMHKSLAFIVEGTYAYDGLVEISKGSGRSLWNQLELLSASSTERAKAVVQADFDTLKTNGIQGEVTLSSLKTFVKAYKGARVNIAAANRPSAGTEVQMINGIAFRSPDIRDMYELKAESAAPTTMAQAVLIIETILSGRKLSEDLDRVTRGEAPPGGGTTAQDAKIAELEAKVAALDPNKNGRKPGGGKPGGGKVEVPRNPDGSIARWVKGMTPCKCKVKQPGDAVAGGHLFRDCKTNPPKAKEAEKEPVGTGAVVEFASDETDETMAEKLAAHFAIVDVRVCQEVVEEKWPQGVKTTFPYSRSPSLVTTTSETPLSQQALAASVVQSVQSVGALADARPTSDFILRLPEAKPPGVTSLGLRDYGKSPTVLDQSKLSNNLVSSVHIDIPDTKSVDPRGISRETGQEPSLATGRQNAIPLTPDPLAAPANNSIEQAVCTVQQHWASCRCGGAGNAVGDAHASDHSVKAADEPTPPKQWLPPEALENPDGFVHTLGKAGSVLSASQANSDKVKPAAGASPAKLSGAFDATIDSGCSGSLTNDRSRLENTRACSERFRSATGVITTADCVGDMPVFVRCKDGAFKRVVFRNVRCVPGFAFTLISVTQLWEEQRVDSLFADVRALRLPEGDGGSLVPYLPDVKLPTLHMVSAVGVPARQWREATSG